MSDFPCSECMEEGRGPFAHKRDCSRQRYKMPLEVCRLCKQVWLMKDTKLCEYCVKKVKEQQIDPLEDYWNAESRAETSSRGTRKAK
jgi:RecJ-like exonuclease